MRGANLAAVFAMAALSACVAGDDYEVGSESYASKSAIHETRNFRLFQPGGPELANSDAKIKRTADGISVQHFRVHGLTPGNAVLVLFATFPNPEECNVGNGATGSPCGPGDLPNGAAGGSVMLAGSGVLDAEGHIEVNDIDFPVGDTSRCFPVGPPCRAGVGNPYGAETHLVIKDNGPASDDPDELAAQLSSFVYDLPPKLVGGAQFVYYDIPEL